MLPPEHPITTCDVLARVRTPSVHPRELESCEGFKKAASDQLVAELECGANSSGSRKPMLVNQIPQTVQFDCFSLQNNFQTVFSKEYAHLNFWLPPP